MVPRSGGRQARRSHLAGFAVRMTGQAHKIEEVRVTLRLAATIGLLAALAPAMAHAQTNLDQGKSPAQIFANDCAACHKAARTLAKGKDNATLTDFLREHYTTSREQAAALAAYVLRGGGGEGGGSATQGQKPAAEHARGAAEESKPARPARQAARPEAAAPATAKPQRPTDEGVRHDDDSASTEEPSTAGRRHAAGRHDRHEKRSVTAARSRRKEPETAPAAVPSVPEPAAAAPEPAAVVTEPGSAGPTETPNSQASQTPTAAVPTAAAPTDTAPGESAPLPRDDIPD